MLYTDYDNLAIIYSCGRLTDAGTCQPNGVKLWVIGRTIDLTDTQLQHVEKVLEGVCLEYSALHMVPTGKILRFVQNLKFEMTPRRDNCAWKDRVGSRIHKKEGQQVADMI